MSSNGYLLTNAHVVSNADSIIVSFASGKEYKAVLIGSDEQSDIALLKIAGKEFAYLELADSDKLRVGEIVLALGNPFGVGKTLTMGIVSAKNRDNVGIAKYENVIQTDAAINPGNSGGPLLNIYGEVVGINTAILSRSGGSQGVGFAVPANMAKYVFESLLENGKVERGYLGVYIQDVTDKLAKGLALPDQAQGAIVSDVVKGSPAEKAGIKQGDLIVMYNNKAIQSSAHVRNLVAASKIGEKVPVQIIRDKKKLDIFVVISKNNESSENGGVFEGKDKDSFLGSMSISDITNQVREKNNIPKDIHGIFVESVMEYGAASRAGIESGDVVRSVNNKEISSVKSLEAFVKKEKAPYVCLVYREGVNYFLIVEE